MTIHTQHPAGTPIWTDLMTSGADDVRRFYGALFGWRFQGQGSEYGDYSLAYLGEHAVAAVVPQLDRQSAWCLYFASDDVYVDAGRIRELGGEIMVPAMQVGNQGHLLMARDPNGTVFGLWQPGKQSGLGLTGAPGAYAWGELHTHDAERARDFYTALLGNTSRPIPEMDYHTLYHGDEMNAGIMQMTEQWHAGMSPQWMIYFEVEDADLAVETAGANGGRVLSPPHDSPYGRIAVLQDPAGATFSVIQPPRD
ncbi:hydroxylase [Deinococcus aerius]|uniref:Hydroxylase n=1 Tax=Deinococcus aerius TaxID=200253 RepID=A0A2I9DT49_9DEIO|nr:VOC family protein [Deinococcus aerius]GBF05757.1 hydroxylase [Deinococcus aerius]